MVDRGVIKTKLAVAETHLNALKSYRFIPVERFENDLTLQAAILHHLQVAVQACCDIASHIVADEGWGVPGTTKELFDFLLKHRVITASLANELKSLVGLRNLIVHGYDKLDVKEVHATLSEYRKTLARFFKVVAAYARL